MNKRVTAALVCLAVSPLAMAGDGNYRLGGFATFGVNKASNDSGYFEGQDSDPDYKSDSLAGIQLDFTVNERATTSIQLLGRADEDWDPEVEWAYLNYHLTDQTSLRVGKQRLPLFYYSEYMDARYALPWVRPNQEVYQVIPTANYDGGEVLFETGLGDYQVVSQLYVGESDFDGLIDNGTSKLSSMVGATTTLEEENFSYRLSFLSADLELNRRADELLPASALTSKARFYGAGVHYDNGRWLVVSELVHTELDSVIDSITAGYLTLGYHSEQFMPYVTLSRLDAESKSEDPLQNRLMSIERSNLSAGLRWSLSEHVSIKGEISRVFDFGETSGALANNQQPVFEGKQLIGLHNPYDDVVVSTVTVDVVF